MKRKETIMARPKKSTTKRTPSKRATTKRTPKKTAGKAQTGTATIKMLDGMAAGTPSTKRPANNPDMPQITIDNLNHTLNEVKTLLERYAQHLRALDRKRLNGVGIKKMGFIERAYEFALEKGGAPVPGTFFYGGSAPVPGTTFAWCS
jgi:hypothetical protein